jgi:hypothetical protein
VRALLAALAVVAAAATIVSASPGPSAVGPSESCASPLARVLAPGEVEQRASTPADSWLCTGAIRPGAPLLINDLMLCTAGWVLQDEEGALYVATAGHCFATPGAHKVAVPGVADDVGDVAFTTGNAGIGKDFALVRIDAAFAGSVDGAMCRWGGPTRAGSPDEPRAIANLALHYGWGNPYDESPGSRGRTGIAPVTFDAGSLTFVLPTGPGDSGSPLQTRDGTALAIVTHTALVAVPPVGFTGVGVTWGTRLDHGLLLAQQATGHTFTLVLGPPVELADLR